MSTVRQHERKKPQKPAEYIDRHLALIERRADQVAFLKFNGVGIVSANDDRLAAPIADPVPGPGRVSVESIKQQLKDIAKMIGWQE
jgi:hypothetical protein